MNGRVVRGLSGGLNDDSWTPEKGASTHTQRTRGDVRAQHEAAEGGKLLQLALLLGRPKCEGGAPHVGSSQKIEADSSTERAEKGGKWGPGQGTPKGRRTLHLPYLSSNSASWDGS